MQPHELECTVDVQMSVGDSTIVAAKPWPRRSSPQIVPAASFRIRVLQLSHPCTTLQIPAKLHLPRQQSNHVRTSLVEWSRSTLINIKPCSGLAFASCNVHAMAITTTDRGWAVTVYLIATMAAAMARRSLPDLFKRQSIVNEYSSHHEVLRSSVPAYLGPREPSLPTQPDTRRTPKPSCPSPDPNRYSLPGSSSS